MPGSAQLAQRGTRVYVGYCRKQRQQERAAALPAGSDRDAAAVCVVGLWRVFNTVADAHAMLMGSPTVDQKRHSPEYRRGRPIWVMPYLYTTVVVFSNFP